MQTQQNNKGVMYKLDFPNGKSYIGVTSGTAARRFNKHCYDAKKEGFAVSRAINKYGKDNIKVNTLVYGSMYYLFDLEVKAIKSFNTRAPFGYNITDGGEGAMGRIVSDSTKEKLRIANIGKKHRPESIEKMMGQRAGIPRSDEVKAKISAKNKGKGMSLEQRKFLSDLAKSKWELIRAMGENRPSGKGFTGFKQSQGVS